MLVPYREIGRWRNEGGMPGDVNHFIVNACNLVINMGDRALAYRLVDDALREGFVRPWKEPGIDSAIRENMLGIYSCYLGLLIIQQKDCPRSG